MRITNLLILMTAVVIIGACETAPSTNSTNNNSARSETKELSVTERPQTILDLMKERGDQDEAKPELTVESPKTGEIIASSTVKIKVKVGGDLKMGKNEAGAGNHVHVILDNQPYAAHYMWDEGFELRNVTDGEHILRMFPSRPWHESYKNDGAFKIIKFSVKDGRADETKPTTDDKGNTMADAKKDTAEGAEVVSSTAGNVDFAKPLLTYSRPKGEYKGADTDAIMIDFWLTNAKLTGDGGEYLVRYSINGGAPQTLDKWEPIWLKDWNEGINTVKLEFIDNEGRLVENGGYNSTEREITITK